MFAQTIQNWLIPHRGNRHQPAVLSVSSLSIFLAGLLLLQLSYNFSVSGRWQVLSYAANVSQSAVVGGTNDERAKAGLATLTENSLLNAAARAKAEDMFTKGYWAHIAPDGTEPWYFFTSAGYKYTYAGENLAKNFQTSSGVLAGWMASPGHKANILNTNYQDIGIAVVNGVLDGEETTLVVAMYGTRANSEPIVLKTTPPTEQAQPVEAQSPQPRAATNAAVESSEQAPTETKYGLSHPLFFSGTMGWGQLISLGVSGSLMPIYVMTHIRMLKKKLHKASKTLYRRRLLELAGLVTLIGTLILGGWGSVG